MGITGLNKFLMTSCKNGISEQNLAKYKEHTFAIDTSIFLYKFMYIRIHCINIHAHTSMHLCVYTSAGHPLGGPPGCEA